MTARLWWLKLFSFLFFIAVQSFGLMAQSGKSVDVACLNGNDVYM
jgi:hypothetical protein